MKPIKKFSTEMNQPKSILESIDSKALTDLINGMGFKDIHELKKEKNLLSKLEALLKDVNPVSEDDAKEIEDKLNKKAEPKSLEDKKGEKEPEVVVSTNSEVSEEETEETEETKEVEEEETKEVEEEETKEVEEEETKEVEEEEKPTRRIMKFEDFVQKIDIRDNITESDEELEESYVTKSFENFISENVVDNGHELVNQSTDDQGIVIPVTPGDGDKTASDIEDELNDKGEPKKREDAEGEVLVTKDQEIVEEPKTAEDKPEEFGEVVVKESSNEINEADIESDEDFTEYAFTVLQNAFGEEFDEAKAQEVVDGLTSKYSGDYGAMVGALKSSLNK